MIKILIVYYSKTGNTEKMAQLIGEGASSAGAKVDIRSVTNTKAEDLLDYDAIIAGSPTQYGSMTSHLKKLFEESVILQGKLEGKVGAAFSSSSNIGGGNETTIMGILQAFLIHGMIIQGVFKGDHYGPVSIKTPDDRVIEQCKKYGERVARLTGKIFSKRELKI